MSTLLYKNCHRISSSEKCASSCDIWFYFLNHRITNYYLSSNNIIKPFRPPDPTMKFKNIYLLALIILASFFTSCNSTKIVSAYTDPDIDSNREKFEKVLIAVVTTNEQARRSAEDKLAARDERFVASHTLLTNKQLTQSLPQSKGLVEQEGFDGVVTMKLLTTNTSSTPVAGYYNGSYWGYHTNFWTGYYQPGYYREDVSYFVETNIFSLKEDKVLWSGITSTTNISQADRVISQVADAVYSQLSKDKFIVK